MTYEEAVTVTGMVINAFPGDRDWTAEQITMYAHGIERLDAEHATRAVLQAQKTLPRRPDVAALIAITRSMSAGTAATPQPVHKPKPLPLWVKRWVCARHLHYKFGKPRDMRVFPEQREYSDPLVPLMPPDEWVTEAQHISDRDAYRAVAP